MTSALTVLDEPAIRRIVAEVVTEVIRAELEAVFLKDPEATPEHDELMTADEVAEVLAVNKRDLRRLVLDGVIPPGIGLGRRRLRWRTCAIREAVARLEAESAKNAPQPLTRSRKAGSVSSVKTTDGGRS